VAVVWVVGVATTELPLGDVVASVAAGVVVAVPVPLVVGDVDAAGASTGAVDVAEGIGSWRVKVRSAASGPKPKECTTPLSA
jgi:hypothetical protein